MRLLTSACVLVLLTVGTHQAKPVKPENFTCLSRNWENLIFSWDPVPSNVATNFTLRFFFPGRGGGQALYSCPQPKEDQPPNTCMLDSTTDPIYRPSHANYYFTLTVSNYFGEQSFPYQINHWAHVIPSQPVGLKVVSKTFSSALLYWTIPFLLENFPPGLHSKVSYQYLRDRRKTWENIDITDGVRASKRFFNLTNLQYANALYDIRVFLRSALATDENHWGAFSSITFRTAATLPGQSPKTDIGSFQVEANRWGRDIYIYWQKIPASLENGDNFAYQVFSVDENGKKLNVRPAEKTESYAMFWGMSRERFKFVIVTANVIGANETRAVVHVPSQAEMPPEPAAFTNIAFDNGTYELSWNPSSNAEITNYTIFWCKDVRERPYQCKGYLDWVHVSSTTSAYNITVPAQNKYQFAIAANSKRASSGMTWAACTAIHRKFVGKINSMWISDTESDRINVTWRLDCSDRINSIEGFVIYYCPFLLPQNDSCKTPEMVEFVPGGPHTPGGLLVGLKPYTTYSIRVAVKTKNGEGQKNAPLRSTTLEGAPTPPRDIKIKNVTNTSMVVEWNPPEAENGVVRSYTVYYGNKVTKVEQPTGQKITVVRIGDLQPYRNYTVTVSAQTVVEGKRSEPRTQVTDIGLPGKIDIPMVHVSNVAQVQIQWDPPKEAGGQLDYYDIETTDGTIYSNITTREKYLDIPRCEKVGRETAITFRVRAVNLGLNENEIFEGPWSDPGVANCFNFEKGGAVLWLAGLWVVSLLCIIAFVAVWMRIHSRREMAARRRFIVATLERENGVAPDCLDPALNMADQAEVMKYDQKWEFPRKLLKLGKVLGSGAFGTVMKAEARSLCRGEKVSTVAVKMVRATHRLDHMMALQRELKVLAYLGKHVNVVNLLGACTGNISYGVLLVIVEYCRFGNLHDYLRSRRDDFVNETNDSALEMNDVAVAGCSHDTVMLDINSATGDPGDPCETEDFVISSVPVEEQAANPDLIEPGQRSRYLGDFKEEDVESIGTGHLLNWAWQVSRGMKFLGIRRVLHGDLATRNILLADNNVVKICDFGLAKSLVTDDIYKKSGHGPLPIKWMAIESIRDRLFSVKSDVWAFGVVLWELFSLAETPYPGIANDSVYQKLAEGFRMAQPKYATEDLYKTMLRCWDAQPAKRPSFAELEDRLADFLDEGVKTHYVAFDAHYEQLNAEPTATEDTNSLAVASSEDNEVRSDQL